MRETQNLPMGPKITNCLTNLVWKRCNISGLNGTPNLSVATFCPKSCATCGPCRNSYERFVIPNSVGRDSIRKSCNWVSRVRNTKPNLWFKRCEIDIVKEMCPKACELCEWLQISFPSLFPQNSTQLIMTIIIHFCCLCHYTSWSAYFTCAL